MEEDLQDRYPKKTIDKIQLKRLINETDCTIKRKVEKNKESGIKIYAYSLMVRNSEEIKEIYFSRTKCRGKKCTWYGKLMYTVGPRKEIDRSKMYNHILEDEDAKMGYETIRKKYNKQKKAHSQ